MRNVIALLDACVLFRADLRDTLLYAAAVGLYEPKLTIQILDEVQRNLVAQGRCTPTQASDLLADIVRFFDEAMVPEATYAAYVAVMTNDPKDRHVAAAAVAGGADVIVTSNLRDFPETALAPFAIEAVSPDTFLLQLFAQAPEQMVDIVIKQAARLRRPPMTVSDVLKRLSDPAPEFVRHVRTKLESPDL